MGTPLDIESLEESPHLLDLLIKMEDVLDTFDIYVFKNWMDGEVVEGPMVRRYWLDMSLRFPLDRMPDPRAGLRLLKHGVRVDYQKRQQENVDPVDEGEPDAFWLVRVSIPRRLITDLDMSQFEEYEDAVDIEDVQDAKDDGLNAESGYVEDGDAPK